MLYVANMIAAVTIDRLPHQHSIPILSRRRIQERGLGRYRPI
jgi:hypothetical protein